MPAWPFDRRLDYRSFSYEFDLQRAMDAPERVVDFLLHAPPEEVPAQPCCTRIDVHTSHAHEASRVHMITST